MIIFSNAVKFLYFPYSFYLFYVTAHMRDSMEVRIFYHLLGNG